jgi:hypothetical protein
MSSAAWAWQRVAAGDRNATIKRANAAVRNPRTMALVLLVDLQTRTLMLVSPKTA